MEKENQFPEKKNQWPKKGSNWPENENKFPEGENKFPEKKNRVVIDNEEVSKFSIKQSFVYRIFDKGFSNRKEGDLGALSEQWSRWLGIYDNGNYNVDDELQKANLLVSQSGRNIKKAIDFLEYAYTKRLDINDESWNEFISITAEM